ncbi:MAG: HipA N-terminal domain-containing protein [Collinsella sp.]
MVGRIVDAKKGGPRFSYDPGYLSDPAATAISRSLPLTRTPYSIQGTRAFFDGLIRKARCARRLSIRLAQEETIF